MQTIKTQYPHVDDFKEFPGQVYLMIILEVCNSFASLDIQGAENSFKSLSLSNFPGENVPELVTFALKYIEVIENRYALPVDIGLGLIKRQRHQN